MSAVEEVFNALSQLCEEKGNAYWVLSDAARDRGYHSDQKDRNAIHVAHGEYLAAIEAFYLARKTYRIANDAQAVIA